MQFETIQVADTSLGVRRITLNRPQVRNAINSTMGRELDLALTTAEDDTTVQAVILTGSGTVFCAGMDMRETALGPLPEVPVQWWYERPILHVMLRIWDMGKPVIAAVNGPALGGGCDLSMICDMTLASDHASFGEPEVRHISAPPCLMMPWLVGPKRAKELLLTGDTIDARTAREYGIVNRVVDHNHLLQEAEALAARIAKIPSFTIRLNKQSINFAFEAMGLKNALAYNHAVGSIVHTSEPPAQVAERRRIVHDQGLKAFLQHRDSGFERT